MRRGSYHGTKDIVRVDLRDEIPSRTPCNVAVALKECARRLSQPIRMVTPPSDPLLVTGLFGPYRNI